MAIDDVYALNLYQTYAGQRLMNTFVFRMKTATDPSQAAAQSLADAWKNFIRTFQTAGCIHSGWMLQQLRGGTATWPPNVCHRDGGRRLEGVPTGTSSGSQTGEGLPPQVAQVVTLNTGFSGRRRRGRTYIAGISEQVQDQGLIATATLATNQTSWNTHLGIYGVGGTSPDFELGVWSMREATGCEPTKTVPSHLVMVENPDPVSAYLGVISAACRQILYNQRRRTIGVGR